MLSPRRPRTNARTNKRRRWLDVSPSPSPSSSKSPIAPSTRLTTLRQESGGDPVAVLNRLLNTLKENEVPGPQFFRLHEEFTAPLGEGGQGNVRGLNEKSAEQYKKAGKKIANRWPVHLIAIKQYQRKTIAVHSHAHHVTYVQKAEPSEHGLDARFRATEAEVLALSPNLFRGHPNIVQLMGWGLCLDTIENPQSPCCGSLQTPLLILERADMNFRQFLQRFLPEPPSHSESDEEQGRSLAETLRSGAAMDSPQTEMVQPPKRSLANRLLDLDVRRYETVRRLCLDIGNGLQSLHEHRFTHGDLKPENILIFKSADGLCAKLCDFGCARGEISDSTSNEQDGTLVDEVKEQYLGTETWLPPKEEITSSHNFEGLRKCDLYVYGLVVWSAICLKGGSPPQNPKLEEAREDLTKFISEGGLFLNRRQEFASSVIKVLESTLIRGDLRIDTAPWRHLPPQKRSNKSIGEIPDKSWLFHMNIPETIMDAISRTFYGDPTKTRNGPVQDPTVLTSSTKAEYNGLSWWRPESANLLLPMASIHDKSWLNSLRGLFSNPSTSMKPKHGIPHDDIPGPASSARLSPDENALSMTLFEGSRRREDARRLLAKMDDVLHQQSGHQYSNDDNSTQDFHHDLSSTRKLYYDARFRSRILYDWWSGRNFGYNDVGRLGDRNFLQKALKLVPPLDICTLAWLCKGPVGNVEVRSLSGDLDTWRSIMNSDPSAPIKSLGGTTLNESQKLDRFLLLLQFGAKVEQMITEDYPLDTYQSQSNSSFRHVSALRYGPQPLLSTILSTFVHSCRPATVSVVVREIHRRFQSVRFETHVSESTKQYMVGYKDPPSYSQTFSEGSAARLDLDSDAVKGVFAADWYRKIGEGRPKLGGFGPFWGSSTSERSPLLKLPRGWKPFGKSNVYEEEFSQSFTLTRPTASLASARQIPVGFLDKGKDYICHVDLASCIPPSAINTEVLENRFPFYDEDWFAMEWRTEISEHDVLWELKANSTFAVRVNLPKMPRISIPKMPRISIPQMPRISIPKAVQAVCYILFFILFPFVFLFFIFFIVVLVQTAMSKFGWN